MATNDVTPLHGEEVSMTLHLKSEHTVIRLSSRLMEVEASAFQTQVLRGHATSALE